MRSKMAVAGHPIHPMLVTLPIGLFVWTLVADVVYLLTTNMMWYDVAFWSGIGGVVGGVIAAIAGFGDYLSLPFRGKARVAANAHMLLNLAIVALFFAAVLLMINRAALAGDPLWIVVTLHSVGVGLLLVSGWLGGELVYRFHAGVVPRDTTAEYEPRPRISS